MADVLGRSDKIVTEMLLDASQHRKEIKEVAKDWKAYQKELKEVAAAQDALDHFTGKTGGVIDELTNKIFNANVASGLAMKAFGALGDGIAQVAQESAQYNRVLNAYKGDLSGARMATKGMVSDLEIMQASVKMSSLGIRMANDDLNELMGAAVKMAPMMGTTTTDALDSMATALARQSKAVADNIGVVIDAEGAYEKYAASVGRTSSSLTEAEKKQIWQREFITQLVGKARELPDAIDSATARMRVFFNEIRNFWVEVGADIDRRIGAWFAERERSSRYRESRGEPGIGETTAQYNRRLAEQFEQGLPGVTSELEARYGTRPQWYTNNRPSSSARGGGAVGPSGLFAPGSVAPLQEMTTKEYADYRESLRRGKSAKAPKRTIVDELMGTETPGWSEVHGAASGLLAELSPKAADGADWGATADAIARINSESRLAIENAGGLRTAWDDYNQTMKTCVETIEGNLLGSMAGLASGMWEAADAAIQGSESFGMAMAKMTKDTLLNLAQQATAQALMCYARYAASWGMDAGALSAAIMYTAVAGLSGGIGIGASIGIRDAGGYDKKKEVDRSTRNRPSYGKTIKEESPVFNVFIYANDARDPSAVWQRSQAFRVVQAQAA